MSGKNDRDAMREKRAEEAVRDLTLPAAPEPVRARARAAFLQGMASVGEPPARRKPSPARLVAALVPLAAALALVLVYLLGSRPAERWIVTHSVEPAGIDVERGVGTLGSEVRGGRIEIGEDSEMELQLDRIMRIRFLSGTVARVPDGPGSLFRKSLTLHVEAGEAFGTTAGQELPFTFRLSTPEASAVLTGTTFAVFRTDEATCFCLYQGSLDVHTADDRPVPITVGHRVFVYRDGRIGEPEPLPDYERSKLGMIQGGGIVDPLPEAP